MTVQGEAIYFDGRHPRAEVVTFDLDDDGLVIADQGGNALARWPKSTLQRLPSGPGQIRLASSTQMDARIEVVDAISVAALADALADFREANTLTLRRGLTTATLILAAVISVAGVIAYGIPAVATRLAPLVPPSLEIALGEDVGPQIIKILSHGSDRASCAAPAGLAALTKATQPLIAAAQSPLPVSIDVIDMSVPNAFALPGGKIIVLRGLLDKVAGPEELLGVIAHELGHVAHRDAMRRLIESAGLSAVVGAVIGDYTGSTMSVLVGRSLIDASFSREVEADADAYGVMLMRRTGHSPRALGDALAHMAANSGDFGPALAWLSSHPSTPERVARLQAEGTIDATPIISDAEWASLKAICR